MSTLSLASVPWDTNPSLATRPASERALAKVNLSLRVKGRRRDGYHELESLVAFADFGDELRFDPAGEAGLSIDGPFARAIVGFNLVETAAQAVRGWYGAHLPGRFTLTKRIPVAAGLGGGSADAAAAIRALARAYRLPLEDIRDLPGLAAAIGADVPVCLAQVPSWMRGLGERVEPLQRLCPLPVVLVNPGAALATRDVFRALSAPDYDGGADNSEEGDRPVAFETVDAAAAFLIERPNDLEAPAKTLAPVVSEVLDVLRRERGCLLARLSGSGPTCFGLFSSREESQTVASRIAGNHTGWWVTPAMLG